MGKLDKSKHILKNGQDQASGMLGRMIGMAKQLPGGEMAAEFAQEQFHNIETRAMRELKQRLDAVDGRSLPSPVRQTVVQNVDADQAGTVTVVAESSLDQHPGDLLDELLERAQTQDQDQAKFYLYTMILRELVPDEARILGALSDGDTYPLVHVGIGAPIGSVQRVAENFSSVGKAAAVKLREMTPIYIAHLRNLDLIETGPEDSEFEIQYQVLESDRLTKPSVQYAEKTSGPGKGVKFIRRVVRISELGKEVWNTRQRGYDPDDADEE